MKVRKTRKKDKEQEHVGERVKILLCELGGDFLSIRNIGLRNRSVAWGATGVGSRETRVVISGGVLGAEVLGSVSTILEAGILVGVRTVLGGRIVGRLGALLGLRIFNFCGTILGEILGRRGAIVGGSAVTLLCNRRVGFETITHDVLHVVGNRFASKGIKHWFGRRSLVIELQHLSLGSILRPIGQVHALWIGIMGVHEGEDTRLILVTSTGGGCFQDFQGIDARE